MLAWTEIFSLTLSPKCVTAAPTSCQIFHLSPLFSDLMTLRLSDNFFPELVFSVLWVGYVKSDDQMYDSSTDHNGFTLTRTDLLWPLLNASHKLLMVVSA